MTDSNTVNLQAFEPYNGGDGVSLNVTIVSSSAQIPGLSGGQQGNKSRVVVTNAGDFSACIKFGRSGAEATIHSYEILPGTSQTLKPRFNGPAAMWIAAICRSGTTTINVCAGEGT